jgi:hypothetical protein
MAREFPDASFLGLDLAPTWNDRVDVPENAVFELCNVVEGIPCPDETFDVVHCRALMGGVSGIPTHGKSRLMIDTRLGQLHQGTDPSPQTRRTALVCRWLNQLARLRQGGRFQHSASSRTSHGKSSWLLSSP